jgi:hypothetical protein
LDTIIFESPVTVSSVISREDGRLAVLHSKLFVLMRKLEITKHQMTLLSCEFSFSKVLNLYDQEQAQVFYIYHALDFYMRRFNDFIWA